MIEEGEDENKNMSQRRRLLLLPVLTRADVVVGGIRSAGETDASPVDEHAFLIGTPSQAGHGHEIRVECPNPRS